VTLAQSVLSPRVGCQYSRSVIKKVGRVSLSWLLPGAGLLVAIGLLVIWFRGDFAGLVLRIPGADRAPGSDSNPEGNPVLAGKLIVGEGRAPELPGAWPGFRGPMRDGRSLEGQGVLARKWQPSEPRELWSVDVGEGYAGPVILNGRVYLMDYDRDKKQDALRCLSLADGREIWRYAYPVHVKRNHGMSRTVPATSGKFVVAMGPKCHVVCVDSISGELRWGLDLVRDYGTTVPPWYAGQCPLADGETVVLAPGGTNALLMAVDIQTGKERWHTPNPRGWKMTHSSVMPMEFGGERMYVYCANNGVCGVSAKDGSLLWETSEWKISIATVPSPVPLGDGRIFLSGGYNAGSLMLQLKQENGRFAVQTLYKLGPEVFGATQQTPILHEGHLYGVRPDGQFACLGVDGKTVWASGSGQSFGLGSFLMAEGMIFALNDSGLLRLLEAKPEKYTVLAQVQVLKGRESWGPMALAGDRLLARDLTRMVCLEVGKGGS
jgi:outer membrane protein assembly factor BamB